MDEALFQIVNLAVLPFWLLMIGLPRWRATERLMRSPLAVAPWLIAYAVLIVPQLPAFLPLLVSPTLEGVAGALGKPEVALVGWIHYLAFDLFVGRWEYLDARQRETSAWVMAPPLLLTLLAGPCGLLAYLAVRTFAAATPQVVARPGPETDVVN